MADNKKMDFYFALCSSYSVPLWVAPLLHTASRLQSDAARRRKVYRLIQRRLLHHGVGCGKLNKPTYVYPEKVKQLIRAVFPEEICDYHDPQHQNVVTVTMEDMNSVSALDQSRWTDQEQI
ncbi:coiled-coil-helix-coiled-coil-helix domain-containing protein 7 isoform X1 [Tachysurus ichikawai]